MEFAVSILGAAILVGLIGIVVILAIVLFEYDRRYTQLVEEIVDLGTDIFLEKDHADFCRFHSGEECVCMDRTHFNPETLHTKLSLLICRLSEEKEDSE